MWHYNVVKRQETLRGGESRNGHHSNCCRIFGGICDHICFVFDDRTSAPLETLRSHGTEANWAFMPKAEERNVGIATLVRENQSMEIKLSRIFTNWNFASRRG